MVEEEHPDHVEPHMAINIPVSVTGVDAKLFMQFDTGSPSTFFRPGAIESLQEHGVEIEIVETEEGKKRIKQFEFLIGENVARVESGQIYGSGGKINLDDPDAVNIIGSIGADLIDQRFCEIDFPATEIRLSSNRPEEFSDSAEFTPFKFKGRRIMLPAKINGTSMELFYDSGCSSFGFLTSKYHFNRFANQRSTKYSYNANRHGDPVFIHHQGCNALVQFGKVELPVKRVSYAELYSFLQVTLGRIINGGFFGNKSLTESTLVLDGIANEFLVIPYSDEPQVTGSTKAASASFD